MAALTLSLDFNKRLVPTAPVKGDSTSEADFEKEYEDYQNQSSIGGIFKSFTDAPGGFSEEMDEIMWSLGLEYSYNHQFMVRGGYFHESESKGNRKYFSVGAGFKLSMFQLDAAYLISTAQSNPLDQTLRFSLAFNFDGLKDLANNDK